MGFVGLSYHGSSKKQHNGCHGVTALQNETKTEQYENTMYNMGLFHDSRSLGLPA